MQQLFSDDALIQAGCAFESALARACAAEGLIEPGHCDSIVQSIANIRIDSAQLSAAAHHAGTLAIPLVAAIRAEVTLTSSAAADVVHLGGTSQDLADTVMVLQCRHAAAQLCALGLSVCDELATLAHQHIATPMVGRTLLRRALPITFGLKVSHWLAALADALVRLDADAQRLSLQFGGAVGTFAGLDGRGQQVSEHLAQMLQLPPPERPWQTRRNTPMALGASLGLVAGSICKIAQDIALLGQDEIGEVFEASKPGRGGSSAMSHKRNPTGSQQALASARRIPSLLHTLFDSMAHEHERGLTGWQLELPILAQMFIWTYDALQHTAALSRGLEIRSDAMMNHLLATGVGTDVGEARALTEAALREYERDLRPYLGSK